MQTQQVAIAVNLPGRGSKTIWREANGAGHAVCVLPYDPVLKQVVMVQEPVIAAVVENIPGVFPSLVSGKIENGESIEAAAKRELKEETGIDGGQTRIIVENVLASPTTSLFRLSLLCVEVDTEGLAPVGQWKVHGDEYTRPLAMPLSVFLRLPEIRKGNVGSMADRAVDWLKREAMTVFMGRRR